MGRGLRRLRVSRRALQSAPDVDRGAHSSASSAQRQQPRARIFAALGVVRRRCGQAVRGVWRGRHALVEFRDRQRVAARIAADLVERQQAVVTIEGGILERLRHHRPGELLHLEGESAHARMLCARARARSRSSVSASRRKSKMPGSDPNHSARALSIVVSMIARSAGGWRRRR